MATLLEGDVEVVRVDELLDVNPANIRTKKLLTDLTTDGKSAKAAFAIIETALIHDNISQKQLAASGQTYGHIDDAEQEITGNKLFQNQAHGGSSVQSFSASQTFDSDDGNNQSMLVTASTNVGISNENPGTYIFELEINTATPPTITPNANLGTVMDGSADFLTADNDINIITVYVNPSGAKRYTVSTITA